MKTLVLCVDRDDDLGAKGGIEGPVVGREENLHAANRLGLVDPEDPDVNTMFTALSVYDELVRAGTPAEIATISGDVRVGPVSDRKLTRQLDEVIEYVKPDSAFLVSDGAEDESVFPMIASRLRVDHVRRVYVRQAPAMESTFFTLARAMKDRKIRFKFVVPFALSLMIFGALYGVNSSWAVSAILVIFGAWILLGSMPLSFREMLAKPGEAYEQVRNSALRGNVSIVFNFVAVILFLFALFVGVDAASTVTEYPQKFIRFAEGSVAFFAFSVLAFEGGKLANALLQKGRAPRHVLVVAAVIIALALLTVGLTQVLSPAFGLPPADVSVILGSIGLAILLIVLSGLTYRPREEVDVEHGWRH
jgi:putative membrane protein